MSFMTVLKRYKLSYANYLSVMWNIKRNKAIIKVKLRDGKTHNWNWGMTFFYAVIKVNPNLSFDINLLNLSTEGPLKFEFKGRPLTLITHGSGDILSVFVREDYKFLNAEDENVIDIGANIGDSSLYFALCNAKKVVALEPYAYSYSIAIKNIQLNNMDKERVTLLNAGYGEDGTIIVDSALKNTASSDMKSSKEGVEIRTLSLKTLLKENDFETAVLKMDCEGCEYNILKEDNDTLRKFKRIMIEYHYGYDVLKTKLESCGFTVSFTKPRSSYNKDATNPNMSLGYIYAASNI